MGKRANGEGSVYQRKDGRWCGTLSIEKAKRKHFLGRTRAEVAKKLTSALDEQAKGTLVTGPRQTVRQFFTQFIPTFFSDLRIEIDFLLAEGDRVDCHFVALFSHTGEFAGVAPRGNELRVPAVSTFRIAGGKLAEAWEIYDSGDMLRQIQA